MFRDRILLILFMNRIPGITKDKIKCRIKKIIGIESEKSTATSKSKSMESMQSTLISGIYFFLK